MTNVLKLDERVTTYTYKGRKFEIRKAHLENTELQYRGCISESGYVAIDHRLADDEGFIRRGLNAMQLFYHETQKETIDAVNMSVDTEGMSEAEMMEYFRSMFTA